MSGVDRLHISPEAVAASTPTADSHVRRIVCISVAGCAGALANSIVAQPIDGAKVKIQGFPRLYTNVFDCAVQVGRTEGLRGLYAGFMPAMAGRVVENLIVFPVFDYTKKLIQHNTGRTELRYHEFAFAGAVAGGFGAAGRTPTELVKCRLQTMRELHPNDHPGVVQLCRDILKAEGVSGFFVGYTATLLRQSVGMAVLLGSYEIACDQMKQLGETKEKLGLSKAILCGGISGVCYWSAIYPIDVLKSRIQVYGSAPIGDVLRDLLIKDGAASLFKGLTATLLRAFFSNSALLLTYEHTRKLMEHLLF